MLPLILYTDDTSGNRSKQWNKFDLWCLKLAGLPTKENAKLHNIHMITCSNKCSALDMTQPLVDDLLKLETSGITVYDVHLGVEVLVVAPVICILCDNPRHAEIMNHAGPSATMFCRMCMVSSNLRVNSVILLKQASKSNIAIAELRSKEQTQNFISKINSKRTAKEKSELKTKYGVNTNANPLLTLPIDLHR